MKNPYSTRKGFGLRFQRARKKIEDFGLYGKEPYSRSFDNCFENFDGDAVVWALMEDVKNGNINLERGIRLLGDKTFKQWQEIHHKPSLISPMLMIECLDCGHSEWADHSHSTKTPLYCSHCGSENLNEAG